MLRVESEYVFVCILCVLCVNVWESNRVRVYVCNPAQGKQGETGKKSPLCPHQVPAGLDVPSSLGCMEQT